jgi:hypothetical protein
VGNLCGSLIVTHRNLMGFFIFRLRIFAPSFRLTVVRESVGLPSILVLVIGFRFDRGSFVKAKIARMAAGVRGRLPPAGGAIRPALIVSCAGHTARNAVGMRDFGVFRETRLTVDPFSSLRRTTGRAGNDQSFGAGCCGKVRLDLFRRNPERRRGAAGGQVEGRRFLIG